MIAGMYLVGFLMHFEGRVARTCCGLETVAEGKEQSEMSPRFAAGTSRQTDSL